VIRIIKGSFAFFVPVSSPSPSELLPDPAKDVVGWNMVPDEFSFLVDDHDILCPAFLVFRDLLVAITERPALFEELVLFLG